MAAPLFAPIIEPRVCRVTIVSRDGQGGVIAPATKKNSATIVRAHGSRGIPILLPSEQYQAWEQGALAAFEGARMIEGAWAKKANGKRQRVYRWLPWPAIDYPVNCRALIYRQANVGDAVGYYQAIGDWLQKAGAVVNDKWIVSWDGTRLRKDSQAPRIEIELTEVLDVAD